MSIVQNCKSWDGQNIFCPPPLELDPQAFIPDNQQCYKWWDDFSMPEHIRKHSLKVAQIATELAYLECKNEKHILLKTIKAAALLHDLGKSYCIQHGGGHAQLGGAWVQELTSNPAIAYGVMHHVHWPGEINTNKHFLALAIIYSDKRVKHEDMVSLEERFSDLIQRYGKTQKAVNHIKQAQQQAINIEQALEQRLGVNLNEYPFSCRGLV